MAADVSQIVTSPRVPYVDLGSELQKITKTAADVRQLLTFLRVQDLSHRTPWIPPPLPRPPELQKITKKTRRIFVIFCNSGIRGLPAGVWCHQRPCSKVGLCVASELE